MRIVITGASGFIGSELRRTIPNEHEVISLSRNHKEGFTVTDYSFGSLSEIFQGANLIIHLASVRGKSNDYSSFIENEIMMDNILNAMSYCGCRRIVFMSSLTVYSDQSMMPWTEEQSITPQTFYGLSKITGEYLCHLYSSKGIEYTIFRCGIVYGLEKTKRMISVFIDQASKKETLHLVGKSIALRDFIYVKEVVNALNWAISSKTCINETFNLGSREAFTNYQVAEMINNCFDNQGNLEYDDSISENVINSYMESSKLERAGYKYKYDFMSGLKDLKDGIKK